MKGSDNIREIQLIGAHTKNGLKLRKIMERVIESNEINLPLTISEDLDNKLKHKYNIKEIPCIVIDDKVVSQGRVLTDREFKKILVAEGTI